MIYIWGGFREGLTLLTGILHSFFYTIYYNRIAHFCGYNSFQVFHQTNLVCDYVRFQKLCFDVKLNTDVTGIFLFYFLLKFLFSVWHKILFIKIGRALCTFELLNIFFSFQDKIEIIGEVEYLHRIQNFF